MNTGNTTIAHTSTPTERGIAPRPGNFATLIDALDYAAGARTGMNFHAPRGELAEALSYGELAQQARDAGERLLGIGLAPGDRVGLIAETEGDFVRAFMGCIVAGLIPCPMPLPSAFGSRGGYGAQIRRVATVAGMAAIILAEPYRELVADALDQQGLLFFGTLGALPSVRGVLPPAPGPEAIAYLQFSSGTTQAPRGIAVSHRALMANIEGMAAHALEIGDDDRGMSWLPFYHDMGLVGCMLLPLACQMSIDYLATRDFIRRPGLWPEMISRARATMSYAPSFGYRLAAQRARVNGTLDLGCWRIAGIGGDMVKTANLEDFAAAYRVHGFDEASFLPSYGMAELALGFSFSRLGQGSRSETLELDALERGEALKASAGSGEARAFVCCGAPLPGHSVEIRDDAGQVLGPRQVGAIFVCGPSVMQGYFGDPQATADVLSGDGWLDTGDRGYIADGELFITGRTKDLIIFNGRNIWPQDIEWAVERHVSGIREGGVAAFSTRLGESGSEEGLAVVLECRGTDDAQRAALVAETELLIRQLYGLVAEVTPCRPGTLPRTSSGKLSRAQARDMYRAGIFAQ